ncbi:MAG: restriction endonuclease subunit S [Chloroflexia bacterium]|nr:restriction endonuclease subunit S [Chloroflexia bacterium]
MESKFSFNNKFVLEPIGSFLTKSRDKVLIEDEKVYQRVTVKINNGGIVPRDKELGENIGTKQQYKIKAGQFLMSKIDARNGAFGLVPENLEGAVVTNDFPVFDVNKTKINPEFLVLITTTKEFIHFAQSCSSGTTNRQRIDIEMFLAQRIPLPDIEEQNQIVKAYNSKIKLAEEQEQKASELEKGIEEYLFEELGVNKTEDKREKKLFSTIGYSEVERWAVESLGQLSRIDERFKGRFPFN